MARRAALVAPELCGGRAQACQAPRGDRFGDRVTASSVLPPWKHGGAGAGRSTKKQTANTQFQLKLYYGGCGCAFLLLLRRVEW